LEVHYIKTIKEDDNGFCDIALQDVGRYNPMS
jgi:hypothetical protein